MTNSTLNSPSSSLRRKEMTSAPLSIFHKSWVVIAATALFCLVDLVCLYTVWNYMTTQSPLMIAFTAIGAAVLLDVPLAAAGSCFKAYRQGLEAKSTAYIVLTTAIAAFLLVFSVTCVLRMKTSDLIFGENASTSTIINTADVSTPAPETSSDIPLVAALFTAILPLATSVGSFSVSYMASNPLEVKINARQKAIFDCEEQIIEMERALKEAEALEERKMHLLKSEEILYNEYCQHTEAQGLVRKEAIRVAVMERMHTPDEITAITDNGIQLCDSVSFTPPRSFLQETNCQSQY